MSEAAENELLHYGILRKSGRYPWNSGKDEFTRSMTFQDMVTKLKSEGLSENAIAKGLGLTDKDGNPSITQLRDSITIAKETVVQEQTNRAITLKDKQYSIQAISKELDLPQATVRLRLKNSENAKKVSLKATADAIRGDVDKHQIVDIGKGININMGISPERYRAAVSVLRDEGYETYPLQQKIPGSKNFTIQKVLVPPGTGFAAASKMRDKIYTSVKWSEDEGTTYLGIKPPLNLSSKRLKVIYGDEGGKDRDGVVFIREGVPDLSMGKNKYAQVRMAVDGTHYIKGMAISTKDIPAGVDVVFYTNKNKSTPLKGDDGILKPMKKKEDGSIADDNPFGSFINKQIIVTDKNGVEKNTSIMNLVNEEGDWDTWNNSLSSQMLAKQPQPLIRSQLAETTKKYQAEVARINTITNPVLRRKLLEKQADQIDSDAVDLRAAAMPHQRTQVIIPLPKINKNEIYAPNFETGERVVLIRYPHGGRFEIPEVIVNNNNRAGKALLGNAVDAIGIHPKVAERLSGADFDGDTVVVIPNGSGKIRGSATLGRAGYDFEKGLNGFDPKTKYGGFVKSGEDKDGNDIGNFKLMKNTGKEMGMITNLVTDMSIQGAKPDHVVRAVRHSMVVIDAEKHRLDYRRSAIDNGIPQLKKQYQGSEKSGANSLLSLATAKKRDVPERKLRGAKEGGPIDPLTGEKKYVPTNRTVSKFDRKTNTYSDEKVLRKESVARLALTNDARTLVSTRKDPVELIYADHANAMKGLANSTRLSASKITNTPLNPAAKKVYKAEVDDLVTQLRKAQAQRPLERQANRIANETIRMKRQDDPTLRDDRDRLNKIEKQARDGAWNRMGLERAKIEITDRGWDAIQAGALSTNRFKEILDSNYVSDKRLFELALPRTNTVVTAPVLSRAKAMLATGMTNADIARALGVAPSTIRSALIEEGA